MSPGQLGELEREEKEKPNMKLVFCFPAILGSGSFFSSGMVRIPNEKLYRQEFYHEVLKNTAHL